MNKIFKKLTGRTIVSDFRQFLSVILIVFLASVLLSGFVTNYYMLENCVQKYFDETNLADAWFYVDKVSDEDMNFVKTLGVNADKRYYLETSVIISESETYDETTNSQIYLSNNGKIYVVDTGLVSNPYKESGKWGCVVDKNVMQNNGFTEGYDDISFSVLYDYKGKTYDVKLNFLITGSMSFDECADSYTAWPVFITKETFVSELKNAIYKIDIENDEIGNNTYVDYSDVDIPYNQVLVNVGGSGKNVDEIIEEINNYYSEVSKNNLIYSFGQESIESVSLLSEELVSARKMIYVFPLIFLVVSILIILTTIDGLIIQEKQKIGTLKSIGIPDKKIVRHYSKFGGILCFVGSAIGSIFGCVTMPGIIWTKYRLVYSIPNEYIKLIIPYSVIGLIILSITILGFIVSVFACKSILHKTPIECMKVNSGSARKIRKKSGLSGKIPISVKMALRNIMLKPIRTIMAIIGIIGCVALLLCGQGIGDTISNSVTYDFGKTFSYDISTTYTKSDFEDKIIALGNVDFYEKFERIYASAKNGDASKNVNLYKINERSFMTNIYLESGEVFVSKSIADYLNVKSGDTISVSVGGKVRELVISKIGVTSVLNGIYICDEIDFDEVYKVKGMWIKFNGNKSDMLKYINSINGTNTAITMQSLAENMFGRLSGVGVMVEAFKFFAISLAIIVLLNLIFLVTKERTREIATLKVLGQNNISIVLSLFFEILFMGLIGIVFGLILGYPFLSLVLSINKIEAINYILSISFSSVLLSIIIPIISIATIIPLCYYVTRKINMIESLKSIE